MASEREQKVEEFVAITGSSKQTAESLLAACNDNLEMAINMHMEGVQIEDNNSSSSASNGTQPGTSSSSAAAAHIDDPDDDGEFKNFKNYKINFFRFQMKFELPYLKNRKFWSSLVSKGTP